jgi:hypothetical protein
MWAHVLPASADFQTPNPRSGMRPDAASPVPTQMMSGLEGASAAWPIETALLSGRTDSNVVPLFVVFHRPPVAGAR